MMTTNNRLHGWLCAVALSLCLLPRLATADWKQTETWTGIEVYLGPKTQFVDYDPRSYKFYHMRPFFTKFGEAITITAGSYVFQPVVYVVDQQNVVQTWGKFQTPKPAENGYTWYESTLEFQCCPGANSGDNDVPSQYWVGYTTQGVDAAGQLYISGGRWVWNEPGGGGATGGGTTGGGTGGGSAGCSCQDPATGKWYEADGTMGGLMCPGIHQATHICE